MESLSGSEYFLNQLSDVVANLQSLDAQAIKKRLVRYSNQAISIYDYTTFELKYADGFEMFGLKNEELTMLDIFNTAIPEHREVCGELSGKLVKYVQENPVNPDLNTFNMNYASQHVDGTFMHILFQAKNVRDHCNREYKDGHYGNDISTPFKTPKNCGLECLWSHL